MSLYTTSLNSGSNGNCYYIGNENEAVLVDVGISCREVEKRLARMGLSLTKIKAVFISHEHSDHIRGVEVFSRKHKLPVYITASTQSSGRLTFGEGLSRPFRAYEPVSIGNLSITAFPKLHDASDPHSFIITGRGTTVGVFTDIGVCCPHVITHFKLCHAAFLEANYDEEMLEEGNYPFYLKKRIAGDRGHLSNRQAMQLFTGHRPAFMSHLILAHLSQDNNSPQLVHNLFSQHAHHAHITVASRHRETEVFMISPGFQQTLPQSPCPEAVQMSLF